MAKQTATIFQTSGAFLGTPSQIKESLPKSSMELIDQSKSDNFHSRLPAIYGTSSIPERSSEHLKDWLIGKPCASPPPAATISYSSTSADEQSYNLQQQQQLKKSTAGFNKPPRQSLQEFLEQHSPTKHVAIKHRQRASLTENSFDENVSQSMFTTAQQKFTLRKNPPIILENSILLASPPAQQSENINQRRVSSLVSFNNTILPYPSRIQNPNPARILSPFLDSKNRNPAENITTSFPTEYEEASPMLKKDLSNSKLLFFTPQRTKTLQKSSLFYDLQSITNPTPVLTQPTQRTRIEPISKRIFLNTSDRQKQLSSQQSQSPALDYQITQSQPFLPNIYPRQEKKAFSLVEVQQNSAPAQPETQFGKRYASRNSQSFSQLFNDNSLSHLNQSENNDMSKSQIKSILKPKLVENRSRSSLKKSVGFQETISVHFLQQQPKPF